MTMVSAVQNQRGITVVNGDRAATTRAFGVEPDWIEIRRWAVAEGEFITRQRHGRHVTRGVARGAR